MWYNYIYRVFFQSERSKLKLIPIWLERSHHSVSPMHPNLQTVDKKNPKVHRTISWTYIHGRCCHVFPHIFVWGSCFWFCIPPAPPPPPPPPPPPICHIHLCHTPSFTHHLCHTPSLSHTICLKVLLHTIFHTIFVNNSLTHIFVTHLPLHTHHPLSHTLCHNCDRYLFQNRASTMDWGAWCWIAEYHAPYCCRRTSQEKNAAGRLPWLQW